MSHDETKAFPDGLEDEGPILARDERGSAPPRPFPESMGGGRIIREIGFLATRGRWTEADSPYARATQIREVHPFQASPYLDKLLTDYPPLLDHRGLSGERTSLEGRMKAARKPQEDS